MSETVNKKVSGFDQFILIINCLAALLLLLSYLASIINPQKVPFLAFLGLAYTFLLLINIVFVLFWAIRVKPYIAISLLVIMAGIQLFTADFGFHASAPFEKRSIGDIRVMTYNVHGFGGVDNMKNQSILKQICHLVAKKQPEILNIQEFYINVLTRDSTYSLIEKAMKPCYFYFKPYDYTRWDSTGIAVFSKYPIIKKGFIEAGDINNKSQAIFVDLKYGNYIFRDYCLHLQSTGFDDNDHQNLKFLFRNGVINTLGLKEIVKKLKNAFVERSNQSIVIKKSMDHSPYPFIVTGDFNDTPTSFSVNEIKKGLNNAFESKGSGLGITYYGDFPNFQIDYIFTTNQFSIKKYQILEKKISDHFPILSDLSLDNRNLTKD